MQKYAIFLWSICKDETSVHTRKLCRETGNLWFEESLSGGKVVKNLEIFWLNNNTIVCDSYDIKSFSNHGGYYAITFLDLYIS